MIEIAVSLRSRIRRGWNAFRNRDPTNNYPWDLGSPSGRKPDRASLHFGNRQSIIAPIYNRISLDVATIEFQHVRLDDDGNFEEIIDDDLHKCLTIEANMDQIPEAFIQDCVISMFDEGAVAIVPVEADRDPTETGTYKIFSLRTGRIVEWWPYHVRVRLYNELTGLIDEILLPKDVVGIVENPFYNVMNEPSSTLSRLLHKLGLLDAVDEQSASGKLDLILQLPYTIKSEARKVQAEERRKAIEVQLTGSKYGIAYTDGTERITQLNRPVDNNLMTQIQYLTGLLHSQLGLTEAVFNGTADEATMLNYINGTVSVIASAIAKEMTRKFLTKTARAQGQSIKYFRDPFKLVPVSQIADIADKFTRNEILSSNELRAIIGFRPSKDPRADELRNKNLNASNDQLPSEPPEGTEEAINQTEEGNSQNGRETQV